MSNVKIPAALALTLLGACSSSDDSPVAQPPGGGSPGTGTITVLDRAGAAGLTRFVEVASASSFLDLLEGTAPLTVLAPSNEALDALGSLGGAPLTDPAVADVIVGRCVLDTGAYDETVLSGFSTLVPLDGGLLRVSEAALGTTLTVNSSLVLTSGLAADNGQVHVLDRVLLPTDDAMDTLRARGFDTFVMAIEATGLEAEVEAAGTTVLAPSEAAFEALTTAEREALFAPANALELADRVRMHLIPEVLDRDAFRVFMILDTGTDASLFMSASSAGTVAFNGADLIRTNEPTTGGWIHEVDAFVPSPLPLAATLDALPLTTFTSLVAVAGVEGDFDATDPLTLFAPSDDAFGALAPGRLDELVDPANSQVLRDVLLNHGTQVVLPAGALSLGVEWVTLAARTETVSGEAGGEPLIGVNGASVTTANVYARRGIVHVVDRVLDVQ